LKIALKLASSGARDMYNKYLLSSMYTKWQYTLSYDNSTATYKFPKPFSLEGFEPGIFCSVGGLDDHYATLTGHEPVFVY
jgi:hypothetical protein